MRHLPRYLLLIGLVAVVSACSSLPVDDISASAVLDQVGPSTTLGPGAPEADPCDDTGSGPAGMVIMLPIGDPGCPDDEAETTVPTVTPTTEAPAPAPTTAAPTTEAPACEPGYTPCLPIVDDLNCPDLPGLGITKGVTITGSDRYGLDGNDQDGLGCEP